jgi:hypothetical protein
MEIIGEKAHRALAYVEAVNRQGYSLTKDEFTAYAKGWEQEVTLSGGISELASTYITLTRQASLTLGGGRRVLEPMLDYLCRLRWVVTTDGRVGITALGKAVLREANSPLPASDVGSTLEVVIDPENPFAYAQLMSRIASFEECLVVDPYLDQDQLLTLATFPTVTRILTSNKNSKSKKPVFGIVLGSAPHLEVRMAEEKLLHDRIVIPSDGNALMLGSSLNAITRRFGVATPLEETSSRLIREEYNKIWAAANVVERASNEQKGGLTLRGEAKLGATNSEGPELTGDDLGDK